MDLERISGLFPAAGPETPAPAPGAAQGEPASGGLGTATGPGASPEAVREAREERAAILQHEGGLSREAAEAEAARLHPDPGAPGDAPPTWRSFTLAELQAAADDDWPEIEGRPEALDALAQLLETSAKRAAGEVPARYTQAAFCETCGPVWLWDGAPARVLACPWCLVPPTVPVPRPSPEPEGPPHV